MSKEIGENVGIHLLNTYKKYYTKHDKIGNLRVTNYLHVLSLFVGSKFTSVLSLGTQIHHQFPFIAQNLEKFEESFKQLKGSNFLNTIIAQNNFTINFTSGSPQVNGMVSANKSSAFHK